MSYVACCVLLCVWLLRKGDSARLPARSTDCWTVQAVLGVGRQAVHTQHPGIQQYQSNIIYAYIKHHYVQMGFKKGILPLIPHPACSSQSY